MILRKVIVFALLVLAVAPAAAYAFDGQRPGFIFGMGIGTGKAKQAVEMSVDNLTVGAEMGNSGYTFNWKIGGGVSDKVWIYFENHQMLFNAEYSDFRVEASGIQESIHEANFLQGITGLGVTYFLEPQAPSFFFSGLGGVAEIWGPLGHNEAFDVAAGYQIGAGYEFIKSLSVEVTYMKAVVTSGDDDRDLANMEFDQSISNLAISLNWIWY